MNFIKTSFLHDIDLLNSFIRRKMSSKIIYPAFLMMMLMASESMARAPSLWRSSDDLRRPLRPLRPLNGFTGFTEELGQLQKICEVFSDNRSVFDACQDIKGNVETFQINIEETTKTFMDEQMSILEDVIISVCKAMNDDDFVTTDNEKVKYKHCKKLDIPKRPLQGIFYVSIT